MESGVPPLPISDEPTSPSVEQEQEGSSKRDDASVAHLNLAPPKSPRRHLRERDDARVDARVLDISALNEKEKEEPVTEDTMPSPRSHPRERGEPAPFIRRPSMVELVVPPKSRKSRSAKRSQSPQVQHNSAANAAPEPSSSSPSSPSSSSDAVTRARSALKEAVSTVTAALKGSETLMRRFARSKDYELSCSSRTDLVFQGLFYFTL